MPTGAWILTSAPEWPGPVTPGRLCETTLASTSKARVVAIARLAWAACCTKPPWDYAQVGAKLCSGPCGQSGTRPLEIRLEDAPGQGNSHPQGHHTTPSVTEPLPARAAVDRRTLPLVVGVGVGAAPTAWGGSEAALRTEVVP